MPTLTLTLTLTKTATATAIRRRRNERTRGNDGGRPRAAMLPSDDHGSYAVIDLVAHLYRGGADDRRALAGIWNRYSEATESERKSKGFELVRMHHATLTRMFRDGACARARDGSGRFGRGVG